MSQEEAREAIAQLQAFAPGHAGIQTLHEATDARLLRVGAMARGILTDISMSRTPQSSPEFWTDREAGECFQQFVEDTSRPSKKAVTMPTLPRIPGPALSVVTLEAVDEDGEYVGCDQASADAAAAMGMEVEDEDGAREAYTRIMSEVMALDDEELARQGTKREGAGKDGQARKRGSAAKPDSPESPVDMSQFPGLLEANPRVEAQPRTHKKGDRTPPQGGRVLPPLPPMPEMTALPDPALAMEGRTSEAEQARHDQQIRDRLQQQEQQQAGQRREQRRQEEIEHDAAVQEREAALYWQAQGLIPQAARELSAEDYAVEDDQDRWEAEQEMIMWQEREDAAALDLLDRERGYARDEAQNGVDQERLYYEEEERRARMLEYTANEDANAELQERLYAEGARAEGPDQQATERGVARFQEMNAQASAAIAQNKEAEEEFRAMQERDRDDDPEEDEAVIYPPDEEHAAKMEHERRQRHDSTGRFMDANPYGPIDEDVLPESDEQEDDEEGEESDDREGGALRHLN
jgi:hypothetical protein